MLSLFLLTTQDHLCLNVEPPRMGCATPHQSRKCFHRLAHSLPLGRYSLPWVSFCQMTPAWVTWTGNSPAQISGCSSIRYASVCCGTHCGGLWCFTAVLCGVAGVLLSSALLHWLCSQCVSWLTCWDFPCSAQYLIHQWHGKEDYVFSIAACFRDHQALLKIQFIHSQLLEFWTVLWTDLIFISVWKVVVGTLDLYFGDWTMRWECCLR